MYLFTPNLGIGFVRKSSWLVAVVTVLFLTTASVAQFAEPVLSVEEDWELVLVEPDDDVLSPQFHTVISPFNNLDAFYVQITWNYQELPDFVPGGFQMQGWLGDEVAWLRDVGSDIFSASGETITWTQLMATNGVYWTVSAVYNGHAETWEGFGEDAIIIDGFVGVPDLNDYNPDVSVANSWVTYGENRVGFLGIVEVRYYGASGLLYTDTTLRPVFACD